MRLGFDCPTHPVAQCLIGVPDIAWLQRGRMRDFFLKFFRRKSSAMRLRKCQTVVLHVIAHRTLNSVNAVYTASHTADHINPVNILHTTSDNGTATFLGQAVQTVGNGRCGRPRVDRLLAGRHNVDSTFGTAFKMRIHIIHETEQGQHCDIRVARIQHRVRVAADGHAQFRTQPGILAYVHPDNVGVNVNCADDLRTLFIEITDNVLAHFTAAILYYTNLFTIHIHSIASYGFYF